MKRWIIEKLGGFADVESAIDHVRATDGEEKRELLTLAVKKLYNTIGPDDILQEVDGQWMFKGKPLSEGEQKLLTAEANQFVSMKLWSILQADVKYQANKRMYIKGDRVEDLIAGKLWAFTLDVFKTRLNSLGKGTAMFNNKK